MLFRSVFTCFSKYFDFDGRASRAEFWWFYLFNLSVISIIGSFIKSQGYPFAEFSIFVYCCIVFLPQLSVSSRRLHDVNKSGWNILWSFTILGVFYVLYLWLRSPVFYGNIYADTDNEAASRRDDPDPVVDQDYDNTWILPESSWDKIKLVIGVAFVAAVSYHDFSSRSNISSISSGYKLSELSVLTAGDNVTITSVDGVRVRMIVAPSVDIRIPTGNHRIKVEYSKYGFMTMESTDPVSFDLDIEKDKRYIFISKESFSDSTRKKIIRFDYKELSKDADPDEAVTSSEDGSDDPSVEFGLWEYQDITDKISGRKIQRASANFHDSDYPGVAVSADISCSKRNNVVLDITSLQAAENKDGSHSGLDIRAEGDLVNGAEVPVQMRIGEFSTEDESNPVPYNVRFIVNKYSNVISANITTVAIGQDGRSDIVLRIPTIGGDPVVTISQSDKSIQRVYNTCR